ncbi:polyprenyl synthetase family protein [Thermoleophilia bacterium SCSIO 60948]|nr:polyprenyl synthetase family protein [Thermoleophilia bacterium SCSIO 60948]
MTGRSSQVPPPVTQVLDAASSWLPRRLGDVERRLATLATEHGEALGTAAAATLSAGGKRLRPMLVLLCAGPEAGEGAIRAASAVELVHTATLVHDDVLDDAPLRRGSPTVYATAGRERATAVGDLLLSRAFAELCPPGAGGDDMTRVRLLSAASVELAQGELAQRRDAFDPGVTRQRYLERCRLKTASLFACSCAIGDPSLGAAADVLAAFGAEIGLAFQMLDDVLDVAGPEERTGKARGTDLLDGTVTLPLIAARERDPGLGDVDLRALDAGSALAVCERIERTGVLADVRAEASERVAAAKRSLEPIALDPQRAELLGLVADGVVERYA